MDGRMDGRTDGWIDQVHKFLCKSLNWCHDGHSSRDVQVKFNSYLLNVLETNRRLSSPSRGDGTPESAGLKI